MEINFSLSSIRPWLTRKMVDKIMVKSLMFLVYIYLHVTKFMFMIPTSELIAPTKVSLPKPIAVTRVASIDIVRALTMVLMIFVNDLGSLKNIPSWLEHVPPGVDG